MHEDIALGIQLGAHQAIGMKSLNDFGTDKLKEKYLPLLATGEYISAFCVTEKNCGSDINAIGMKSLNDFGTDKLKEKYLPLLATGEYISAFCVTEKNCGSDINPFWCHMDPVEKFCIKVIEIIH
ncbi:hypothetical protein A3Q56_07619 [Intoshia linei]|uniref:Acyl-CoA dehydrogenase/oxidase N-terminal domain-containing protein n=1 Tax=Intoshia linei TaxID=1819745 RepID=A0A177AR69_9BILA|nr:hypothetical protein A3Q56_07619 [Intoshia linei]